MKFKLYDIVYIHPKIRDKVYYTPKKMKIIQTTYTFNNYYYSLDIKDHNVYFEYGWKYIDFKPSDLISEKNYLRMEKIKRLL